MRHCLALLALLGVVACAAPQTGTPPVKSRNPLSEEAVSKTTWIEEFDVSPDGAQVAFKSARNGNYNIWVQPVTGGEPRLLTDFKPPYRAKNPVWSPDGKTIAFQVDQHLKYQSEVDDVYVVAAAGGIPRNLTNTSWSSESSIAWSPDGRSIAFASSGLGGGGIVSVDVSTGRFKQISATGGADLQWSPDGRWLVYASNRVRDNTFYFNADVYIVDAQGGTDRLLTTNSQGFKDRDPAWSPDSRKVAFISDRSGFDNVMVVDVATGSTSTLTDTRFDHANPTWSPDGRSIAFEVNQEYQYFIDSVAATGGTPQRVAGAPGVNGGMERSQLRGTFQWTPDSAQIIYTHMSPSSTSDLWSIAVREGTARRLTDSRDPSLRDESRFVWPELLKYASFDGMQVQGFLYKPKGVQDGDLAPFVMFFRANDNGQHPVGWQPYIQYYVSKGYVVFAPNFRGSTGQGKVYQEANMTFGGDKDIKDALTAVDMLIARKLIDPNRMGIVGGSTGGFFVMATLIQRPTQFKAAVNFYGVTDLVTLADYNAGLGEFGWTGHMIGGNPLTNPKGFYDRSAIHFVPTFETPIMFLYAEGDGSARYDQVRQIVPVLDHFQKRYVEKLYRHEPHGWYHWRPENVEDSLRRVGAFFDENILGIKTPS